MGGNNSIVRETTFSVAYLPAGDAPVTLPNLFGEQDFSSAFVGGHQCCIELKKYEASLNRFSWSF